MLKKRYEKAFFQWLNINSRKHIKNIFIDYNKPGLERFALSLLIHKTRENMRISWSQWSLNNQAGLDTCQLLSFCAFITILPLHGMYETIQGLTCDLDLEKIQIFWMYVWILACEVNKLSLFWFVVICNLYKKALFSHFVCHSREIRWRPLVINVPCSSIVVIAALINKYKLTKMQK